MIVYMLVGGSREDRIKPRVAGCVNRVLWRARLAVRGGLSQTEMNHVDILLKTMVNGPALQCNEESCTATEERSRAVPLSPP